MKKIQTIMLLGAFPLLLNATEYKEPEKICLDRGWEFSRAGKGEWLPATVPGTVHQDLIDNDKLVNPFYGLNEEKVQWVEKEDWQYRTTFTVTKEQLAHRRNRPYCMGSLYWQLNDSWPVVSWSSIDYYGNWKAVHYQGKRAFAPILINAFKEGDDLCFYTLSDELKAYPNATLQLKLMDFNGKVLGKKVVKGEVPANVSAVFHKEAYNVMAVNPAHTLLQMTLKSERGEVLSEGIYYFSYPKDQELPDAKVSCKVKRMDGKCEVTLSTKQLVRDVFVEIPIQGAKFTDNFFDLLPGQTKKIVITSDKIKKSEPVALKIRHLKGIIL